MITQNNLMRPGTGRGFTAKEAFEAIARAIDAHVEMPNRDAIAGSVDLMGFSHEKMPQFERNIEMYADTGEGRFVHWIGDKLPTGYARMFAEIAQGLLVAQVLDHYEGEDDPKPIRHTTLYRVDMPRSRVPDGTDLSALGWRVIPDVAVEYGVPKAEFLEDMPDIAADVLRELGMTMADGMEFIFDDGLAWFRHTDYGWTQTVYRDGSDPATTTGPDPADASKTIPMPDVKHGPCLYSRRVHSTIDDAYALARDAMGLESRWVGGSRPYLRNLLLMPASPYLRYGGREFYLLLGSGKEGKSRFCNSLSKHLREQAFLGQIDTLCENGLSAENQNVQLATHSCVVFDDVTWEKGAKLVPKLKTMASGLLPGPARMQGRNKLPLEENRSRMILSANHDMPRSMIDEAMTDRVMRVVFKDKLVHHEGIEPMIGKYGFWPFMLVSAMAWCAYQGVHAPGYAWANPDDLTDEQCGIIEQVLAGGHTGPDTPKPLCGWAAMGLVQTTCSGPNGPEHVYRPSSKPEKRAVWDSLVDAYRSRRDEEAEEEALYKEAMAKEPAPEPAPDELTALEPCGRDFGAVETQLGAMGWTGNVFPLKGRGPKPKAPAVDSLTEMLKTPATHVADHCEHDEPMRGFAPAPGFMVLDLDIPKGKDEGKPDGYGVLRALGVGIGDPALVVRTGSGGYHLYYRIPDGADIPQIAHKGASAPLPDLPAYEGGVPIDTRVGGRGFVVMPGSSMPDGRKWQVVREGDINGDHVLPAGLLELIQRLAHPSPEPMPRPDRSSTPVDGLYVPHMNTTPVAEGARNGTMSNQVWGWLRRAQERGMSDAQRNYGLDQIRERFRASGLPDKEIEDCIRRTGTKLGL